MKPTKKAIVRIQVIRVYNVEVEADTQEEATDRAYELSTGFIGDMGEFVDVTTDYAEFQEWVEED